MLPPARRNLALALAVAAAMTALVTAASALLPDRYVATGVGALFFLATWAFVWRGDDEVVERAGLSFGGLVLPGPLDVERLLRDLGAALGWALLMAAIAFLPFVIGWHAWARYVWHVRSHFTLALSPGEALNEVAGQVVIIALPEEAFYRGFLQSKLDEVWLPRVRVFGAEVGLGLVATSVIFALGHYATQRDPGRLAVFFPSLVFGWLRARTRGVGAPLAFHAMCNVLSETLMRGFGVH